MCFFSNKAQPSIVNKRLEFNAVESLEDPAKTPARANDELKKHFRPELINRIDEVIVFKRLEPLVVEQIAEKRMCALSQSLKEKYGVALRYDKTVIQALCTEGVSKEFGARELNRVIQRLIEIPLAGLIADCKQGGDSLCCFVGQNGVGVRRLIQRTEKHEDKEQNSVGHNAKG